MADEFDVFAGAMGGNNGQKPAGNPPRQGGKKPFHRKFGRNLNGQKQNNSPIHGANGEESVNPLLNAPLPTEQKAAEPLFSITEWDFAAFSSTGICAANRASASSRV